MIQSDIDQFKKINAIIERDSKDATYKFALLRGAIEISQEYDHLKQESGNRIEFPLGLLVEKWLLYYYPLIASPVFIPQKNGERENSGYGIAFRDSFSAVTQYYAERGGFSAFYNDYVNEHIPESISPDFRDLVNNLKRTITTMPMKHLGRSVFQEDYSVFRYEGRQRRIPANTPLNQELLIQNLGYFSFSKELYAVFQYFGSFISGEDSLLYKWAEFTKSASKGDISVEFALEKLRTYPITERDVQVAKRFYENLFHQQGDLACVWSGESIKTMNSIQIDHLIPFSVWKNNDLWNLMPVNAKVNSKKSDKIPLPEFIEERRDTLIQYWTLLMNAYPNMFKRGISLSLTGTPDSRADLMDLAIERMKEKCEYLIEVRGVRSMEIMNCLFCSPKREEIVVENELCYARWDKFPVSDGHILVIPFRHVRDLFGLDGEEWTATFSLVEDCKRVIESKRTPDGYNIGWNVGIPAGQTIMHCHCHVIPRYEGDIENPTGGIRGVIPHKRIY